MFLAGEPLFLIVADDSRAALARHLDERDTGIVKSANADAGEIDRLAAHQTLDGLPPSGREVARQPMNVPEPEELLRDRQGGVKAGCCKEGVARPDPRFWVRYRHAWII
jgi:hypothetical protein